MPIRECATGLLLLAATLAAGCHGGGGMEAAAPAGLTERDAAVVYAQGIAIVPNTISNSGGAITQCSVSPPLPVGLSLDPQTCAITGTPSVVSENTIYAIAASNAAGGSSTRLEIEVKADPVASEALNYRDVSVIYRINAPISPATPIATGGEITQYSVSPALPAGLALDPQTGVMTGTPLAVSAPALYTITGSNSVDSVEAQLTIEVRAQAQPPAGLAYSDPAPVYVVGQPIPYDEPSFTGDDIAHYAVSPTLPAGLPTKSRTR